MTAGAMVGQGFIQITPSMRGFRKSVDREVSGAADSGAKRFGDRFRRAGSESGRSLGQSLKRTFDQSASGVGGAALRSMQQEVAKAAQQLSRARIKQQDEAGRVRTAEARLAEAVSKSGAESARAVAAEERLEAARRRQQVATDNVSSASERLARAQATVAAATASTADAAARGQRSVGSFGRSFAAGFRDVRLAERRITGVAGALGGLTRAVGQVTGFDRLGRLARSAAQQVHKQFSTLASQVGGQVAKASLAALRGLGNIQSAVSARLAPVRATLAQFGTRIASPFVQLGTRIGNYLSPVTRAVSNVFSKLKPPTGAVNGIVSSFGNGMRSLVSGAQGAIANVSRVFSTGLSNIATGVVAAGSAAIGAALIGGFGRLASLDEATATMRGLGFATDDITVALENANDVALGTAYSMNDMAAAASRGMTAGIKPGEELVGYLEAIRGAAAASKLPLDNIASIFGKVATEGRAYTLEIRQLADRNIPIWQSLSDVIGVPVDQVRELASSGQISMQQFQDAVLDATGGIAEEMGTTLPAKIRNTVTSLSRLGMAFLGTRIEGGELVGGLYEPMKSFFDMVRNGIDLVTELVTPFFQKWTDFAGTNVGGFLADLAEKFAAMTATVKESGIGALGDGFKNLLSVVGPLGGAFAALGAGGLAGLLTRIPMLAGLLPGLGGALSFLGGPIGIVAAALGGLALTGGDLGGLADGITSMVDTIVGALPGVVNTVVGFVPQIVEGILSAIPALMSAATQIIQSLLTGIITALPILMQGGLDIVLGLIQGVVAAIPMIVDGALALVEGLLSGIIAALPMLIEGALALVTGLLDGIVAALPLIIEGAVTLVTSLVQGLVSALPMLIDGALTLLMGLVQALITNLPLIIDAAIQLVTSLVQGLVEALPLLIQAAIDLVLQLVTAIVENLPMLIEAGIELLLSLILGIVGALPELISTMIGMIGTIVGTLLENLPLLIAAGIELLVAIIGGLLEAIPQLLAAIPEIVAAIWDGLAGVDWLQLGMDIIQGIIDGLLSMGEALWGAVEGLVGGIVDFFPHSPAKKGPMSGSGYPGYSGRDMMDDFIGGMESRQARVARAASAVAEAASFTADARYAASTGSGAPGTGAAGVQQVFNVPEGLTAAEVAEYSARTTARAFRR